MKALIVEDDISLQCFLEHVLKDEFDELLIADNGKMALDMLEALDELPNLIVMDVLMPVMDGFEAAKHIRTIYRTQYLPIVFLTGITDNDAFNRCMTLGDDFLTKPISRTTIVAKVRAHCRNIRLYNEVAVQRDKLEHFHAHTLYEHTMAETIFSNLMQGCYQEAEGVNFYTSSFTNFNGDVVLVAPRPQGGIYAMLLTPQGTVCLLLSLQFLPPSVFRHGKKRPVVGRYGLGNECNAKTFFAARHVGCREPSRSVRQWA
ncbi:response regulator [Enterovibrio coralii]|uniref:response regulator n=1 Tax=Enterovibrio coralii TaxID=294935 RepID=UPI000ABEBCB2|nr:response regulator [Enterovibrio coralii]